MDFRGLQIKDFSGGFTDNYLNAPLNKCELNQNLLCSADKQLITRPGSAFYNSTYPQIPAGDQRINALISYDNEDNLFVQSARALYYLNSGWQTLTGPTSNPALSAGAASTSRVSTANWRGHTFITNNEGTAVMKLYKDSSGSYQIRNAGLPKFPDNYSTSDQATLLTAACTLANDIKSAMGTHFSTTYHTVEHTYSFAANATTLATLITLTQDLAAAYKAHIDDARALSPTYHVMTNWSRAFGNFYIPDLAPPEDLLSCIAVLNALKRNHNYHVDAFEGHSNGSTGSNNPRMDTRMHLSSGSASSVTAATVNTQAYPTFTQSNPIGVVDALISLAEEMRTTLNAHYDDSAGAGGHTTANLRSKSSTTINSEHTLVMGIYKLLLGYKMHRVQDGTTHGGAEGSGTALQTAYDPFSITFTGGVSYPWLSDEQAYDLSDPTDLEEIRDALMLGLFVRADLHMEDGARHSGGAGDIDDYMPNGGFFTYQFGEVSKFNYALVYKNQYTLSGGLTFEDRGTPYVFSSGPIANGIKKFNATTGTYDTVYESRGFVTLGSIPVLANSTTDNYATSAIVKEIYRSEEGPGSILYKIAEIPNATTSFVDTFDDTYLITQPKLYTTGGVVENDPPPVARYLHITGNTGYYGYITEGGVVYPNRIRQSIQYDPDSCPEDFFIDLEETVTGIGSYSGRLVGFTSGGVYSITGGFTERGEGSLTYSKIHSNDGCIAHNSIVETPLGLFWWGYTGIYWTDGYQVRKINQDWLTTYATLVSTSTQRSNVQGAYDSTNDQIWWACQGPNDTGPETIYVLDLRWGIRPDSSFFGPFCHPSTDYFGCAALLYYGKQMLRGSLQGYLYKHDASYTTDPAENTAQAEASWHGRVIPYDFIGPATDFGNSQVRKWVPRASFIAKGEVNDLSIQPKAYIDDGRLSFTNLRVIRIRDTSGLHERKFRMAKTGLRCTYHQVGFSNGYVVITNSDTVGFQATPNNAANTVTLAGGAWPADPVQWYISFASDGYVAEWAITERTSATVLTVADPGNTLPSGLQKWVIRGYPKDEKLRLVSYTVDFALRSRSQDIYRANTGDTGANA